MKNICNISIVFKKILVMLLLVISLAACDNDNSITVSSNCSSSSNKISKTETCVDTKDQNCMGCEIFGLIFDAVGKNVMRLHKEMTGGAMAIMMICFSLWLAKRLLTFVSSVTDSSIAQVWNEITRQGFLCLICGILASSPTMLVYAVNTFVYPIYAGFLKLGLALLENAITNSNNTATSFTVLGETVEIKNQGLSCSFADGVGLITEKGFPAQLKDVITCMIKVLKVYLTVGGDIAHTMMAQPSKLVGAIAGLVVYLTFWVVKISFVFYLVDTIFQMGIIILLLPMYIMFYAFKSTRKWTGSAFKTMLTSAGFLMCFSVVVSLVLRGMIELVNGRSDLFNPGDDVGRQSIFSELGIGVLCLLLIGFLVQSSMGISQSIMQAMVGGRLDDKFQERLKSLFEKGSKMVISGIGALLSASTSIMPEGIVKTINAAKAAKGKVDRLAGRETNK